MFEALMAAATQGDSEAVQRKDAFLNKRGPKIVRE
jgi:hypothetical protein